MIWLWLLLLFFGEKPAKQGKKSNNEKKKNKRNIFHTYKRMNFEIAFKDSVILVSKIYIHIQASYFTQLHNISYCNMRWDVTICTYYVHICEIQHAIAKRKNNLMKYCHYILSLCKIFFVSAPYRWMVHIGTVDFDHLLTHQNQWIA